VSTTGEPSLYERVGGEQWFVDLVDRFYSLVEDDPVLRPLYPDDLVESRQRLSDFLVQRFGGPARYSESRGHPRLRMRHVPFAIGMRERDAWVRAMESALSDGGLDDADAGELSRYFGDTASMVVNRHP
jgi:hemoglobin